MESILQLSMNLVAAVDAGGLIIGAALALVVLDVLRRLHVQRAVGFTALAFGGFLLGVGLYRLGQPLWIQTVALGTAGLFVGLSTLRYESLASSSGKCGQIRLRQSAVAYSRSALGELGAWLEPKQSRS